MKLTFREIYPLQRMRLIFKKVIILIFLIIFLFPFLSSAQFNHPELKWRVIETDYFLIHYHQGEESFAREVARIAEEVYIYLSQDIGYRSLKKIPIVIENHNDTTGGYTSTLTGKIVIQAQSDPARTSGNLSWPREVIAHELTHTLSFAAIDESLFPLRRMMASLVLPMWFIEGLAQYEGEQWTSLKRMWVSDQARQEKIMSEGDLGAFYFFDGWGRTSGYYQSDSFVRYIFETYGKDKIPLIFDNLRSQSLIQFIGVINLTGGGAFYPVPRFLNFDEALKEVVGKDSLSLYREWRDWVLKKYKDKGKIDESFLTPEKRLTSEGRKNQHPRFSPSGEQIAFVSNRGYDYALFDLYLMEVATKKVKRLERKVNPFFSFSPDGKQIAYSKVQFYPSKRAFLSDIWILNVNSGKKKRITYGQRASEPCFSPDGERLVFVKKQGGNSNLWLFDFKTHKLSPLTQDKDGLAQNFSPDFSPDGKQIVFVCFRQKKRDIYLLKLKDKTLISLTQDEADDRCPVFSPLENKIYFISDREGGVFNLYSINLKGKDLKKYTEVEEGLFDPSLSKDGEKLVVSGYKEEKFSLFLFSLPELKEKEVKPFSSKVELIAEHNQKKETKFKDYPYRAKVKLHYLLPWFSLAEEGSYFSLEGFASDVLEKHQFYFSTSLSENLGYDFLYINQSFSPTFWINAYHIEGYGKFEGKSYPIDKEEKSFGLSYYINEKIGTGISFNLQNLSTFLFSPSDELVSFDGQINNLRAEIGYSNQIPVTSPELNRWGRTLYLSAEWANPNLGSDLEYTAYKMDFRNYWRLSDKRGFALRVLGKRVENKQPKNRILYSLGGIGTLPGYPEDYKLGENLFLSSLEYRFTWLKRIGGSAYSYFDSLGGALFYSMGTTWGKEEELNMQDLSRSCGAELRLRMIPFGKYSLVLRLGIAWPLDYRRKEGDFFLSIGGIF
ncbi:PD40 domain-containing protein [Patescibacteria group bacterium]|nr:PD40 domain-containing protein [Patescibacteria group bacterium]